MAEMQRAAAQALRRAAFRLAALTVETRLARLMFLAKAGFRADQPRVPAGNPDGGRWTGGAIPVSGRGPRGSGGRRIGGRWQNVTPAQEARLAVSLGEMREALRAVRRLDPGWKPTPSLHEGVEGQIAANIAVAREARLREFELINPAVGRGPFVNRWVAAPPTNRRLTKSEQEEVNRIGRESGCHRCGTFDPKTSSGNFIGDHQIPKSQGTPTRIYPHCRNCSNEQGGFLRHLGRK